MESITPEIVTDKENLSQKSVTEKIKDFNQQLEESKNATSSDMLKAIQSQQKVVDPLTELMQDFIESIQKDITSPDKEIPFSEKLFGVKLLGEVFSKVLAANISAFKNDGQQSAAKKAEMPKPGMNSLALPNGKEVTKEEIQAGKQLQSQIENINQLRKALPEKE